MDVQQANDILRAVAVAHGQGGERSASHWDLERVAGGANNALYRVTGDGQQIACKLCVPDDRQRAAREYHGMQLLRSAGADVAPEPLWLDESCILAPFPVVMYRWLAGEPLPTDMTGAQWAAFAGTIQQIHTLRQANNGDSGLPDAWFHWFDVEAYWPICAGMLLWRMSATSNTDGCVLPTSVHQAMRASTYGWRLLIACWSAGGRYWSCDCCGVRPTGRIGCVSARCRRTGRCFGRVSSALSNEPSRFWY